MWRNDAVVGTGRRYCTKYYRRPRTTYEIRWYYAASEYVRPNRRPHILPKASTDVLRDSSSNFKNWKLYRKQQWKLTF